MCRFESYYPSNAPIAQRIEQEVSTLRVGSSILSRGALLALGLWPSGWQVRSHGLMDRLPLFHSGGRGSIPLGSTFKERHDYRYLFNFRF